MPAIGDDRAGEASQIRLSGSGGLGSLSGNRRLVTAAAHADRFIVSCEAQDGLALVAFPADAVGVDIGAKAFLKDAGFNVNEQGRRNSRRSSQDGRRGSGTLLRRISRAGGDAPPGRFQSKRTSQGNSSTGQKTVHNCYAA